MSYSYLDNTVAGSLLSMPQAGQQAATAYVPGSGMPLYAAQSPQTTAGLSSAGQAAPQSGAMAMAQQILANPGSSPDNIFWANSVMKNSGGITAGASPLGAGVSSANFYDYGAGPGGGSGTTSGAGGMTVIGQQTPEELARNAAIMGAPIDRSVSAGGSGGGGGGSTSGGSSFGSGLFSPTSSATPGASASSVPILNAPTTPMIGYQQPGGNVSAPTQGGALAMQQADPNSVVNNYLSTAGNQLLGDPSYQRYQQSPGYQYAVDEALKQVQSQGASRGLLDSGRVMRDMTDRAQGMALQDYGNWWNRQNQLYSDYQNRLQGLAGGPVGADQANQLGTNLAQGTYQTGGNLASLFGNQGVAGYGGITNTGAAQSNNLSQAGATQAQIQAANQSTQLAGATMQQRQF